MEPPETTETEHRCPKECGNRLEYGKFVDARHGVRGYSCPDCNVIWSTGELKRLGVIEE